MHTSLLAHALSSIAIGPTITFERLHMVPLLRVDNGGSALDPGPARCDYAVLDDAMASRDVAITEVSEQGSVPEVRVVNRGSRPTLIVDGEELVGAKQNRIGQVLRRRPPNWAASRRPVRWSRSSSITRPSSIRMSMR